MDLLKFSAHHAINALTRRHEDKVMAQEMVPNKKIKAD